MKFKPPKGWDPESDTLYIHESGVRIERRQYRGQEGWFLIPADLDVEVIGFDPTPEGRDQAFAAFAEGRLAKTRKKKAPSDEPPDRPKRGRKPKERPPEEPEEAKQGEPEAEGAEDEDEDEEKDEKEEKDEEDDEP